MRTRSSSHRPLAPALALLALLLATASGATGMPAAPGEPAGDPAPAEAAAPATDAPGVTTFAPTRRAAANAFGARLRESRARHLGELAGLREQLAAAERPERAALQRRLEALKLAWQAELVQLQLERARAGGRAELAAKLERRLAALAVRGATNTAAAAGGAR